MLVRTTAGFSSWGFLYSCPMDSCDPTGAYCLVKAPKKDSTAMLLYQRAMGSLCIPDPHPPHPQARPSHVPPCTAHSARGAPSARHLHFVFALGCKLIAGILPVRG